MYLAITLPHEQDCKQQKGGQPVEEQMKTFHCPLNKTSNLLEGLTFCWLTTIVYDLLTPCYDFKGNGMTAVATRMEGKNLKYIFCVYWCVSAVILRNAYH